MRACLLNQICSAPIGNKEERKKKELQIWFRSWWSSIFIWIFLNFRPFVSHAGDKFDFTNVPRVPRYLWNFAVYSTSVTASQGVRSSNPNPTPAQPPNSVTFLAMYVLTKRAYICVEVRIRSKRCPWQLRYCAVFFCMVANLRELKARCFKK